MPERDANPGDADLSAQEYARLKSLFVELCDLPAHERAGRLREVTPALVRAELEAMLRADAQDHAFGPTGSSLGAAVRPTAGGDGAPLPERIGPYRILRLLGEGGMGRVYEAAQAFPHRTVAVKVIRAGSFSGSLLRRFQQEVDVLARLRHPGIAQIYDAGNAQLDGQERPYFAMEFVSGLPLTRHCEQRGLDVRARLDLFVRVCDAVQHAHERGVIHRDLKPGNILVVEGEATTSTRTATLDGGAQPKILDFGIARLTGPGLQGPTMHTDAGQLIGTIPYMSPEQVTGSSHDLDARSDVYALGVVLYELLSGRLPLEVRHVSIPEAARIIRDDTPQSLSAGSRSFRGDLDTIVSKALDKEPSRRYQSAAALGQDIARYLSNEPILARRASAAYHLRKFAQRNRRLAATLVALLLVLLTAAIGGPILYLQAESARALADSRRVTAENALAEAKARRAEAEQAREAADKSNQTATREAARAKAISDFVINDVLEAVQPSVSNQDVKLADVLAAAAAKARERFKDEPLLEFAIHDAVALSYENVGEFDLAMEQAEQGLACARAAGPDSPDLLIAARSRIGWLHYNKGDSGRAEEELRATLADALRTLAPDQAQVLHVKMALGEVLQSRRQFAEAETLLRDVLAAQERPAAGATDEDRLFVRCSLCSALAAQGRIDDAEQVTRQIMDLSRARPGGADLASCTALQQMATILLKRGRPDKALPLALEATSMAERLTPPGNVARAYTTENAVIALVRLGRFSEAEPLALRAVDAFIASMGDDRYEIETSSRWVSQVYEGLARPIEAERWCRRHLILRLRIAGPGEAPSVAGALFEYEDLVRRDRGDEAAAESACTIADDIERIAPPGHASRARALANLARALTAHGRYDQALPLLIEAHAALPSAGTPAEDRPLVLTAIADLHQWMGQADAAALWRARAAEP